MGNDKGNDITKKKTFVVSAPFFILDKLRYASVEHYMMAEKARLFNDKSEGLITPLIQVQQKH